MTKPKGIHKGRASHFLAPSCNIEKVRTLMRWGSWEKEQIPRYWRKRSKFLSPINSIYSCTCYMLCIYMYIRTFISDMIDTNLTSRSCNPFSVQIKMASTSSRVNTSSSVSCFAPSISSVRLQRQKKRTNRCIWNTLSCTNNLTTANF